MNQIDFRMILLCIFWKETANTLSSVFIGMTFFLRSWHILSLYDVPSLDVQSCIPEVLCELRNIFNVAIMKRFSAYKSNAT
jgi:hypothetical protein